MAGRKRADQAGFKPGASYVGVYFLKVDAAGHSSIVVNNPGDVVDKVFDLFESSVLAAVKEQQGLFACEYADFWGWQGDGGLCVIYDRRETAALQTALQSAFHILDFKLPELRRASSTLNVKGSLHIRLSLHRGSIVFKGYDRRGSIHSSCEFR